MLFSKSGIMKGYNRLRDARLLLLMWRRDFVLGSGKFARLQKFQRKMTLIRKWLYRWSVLCDENLTLGECLLVSNMQKISVTICLHPSYCLRLLTCHTLHTTTAKATVPATIHISTRAKRWRPTFVAAFMMTGEIFSFIPFFWPISAPSRGLDNGKSFHTTQWLITLTLMNFLFLSVDLPLLLMPFHAVNGVRHSHEKNGRLIRVWEEVMTGNLSVSTIIVFVYIAT